jgi:hypothetical protein
VATFNIVKDYDWTSIPRGSGMRNRAPRVYLKSYKIKSSESLNRIKSYANVATVTNADKFYQDLYGNSSPEDIFWIPFFGDNVRSFSNEYGDTFQASALGKLDSALSEGFKLYGEGASLNPLQNIKQAGKNYVDAASQLGSDLANENISFKQAVSNVGANLTKNFSTAPGSYIETPKLYQYAQNDSGLEISFVLSNTINGDYEKNTKMVEHLTKINRPKRKNSVVMEPPRIYEVKLKGVRYIKWAYCSSFSVSFLGTKRVIDGKITPEGYAISMTLTSLTTEVSNFMDKI